MASTKQFKDFILDQLRNLNNLTCKSMMGEYLLYYNNILFGGIYDDRLLIKKTNSNKNFLLNEVLPYENAKSMYWVENIDDTEYLYKLIKTTSEDLKKQNWHNKNRYVSFYISILTTYYTIH